MLCTPAYIEPHECVTNWDIRGEYPPWTRLTHPKVTSHSLREGRNRRTQRPVSKILGQQFRFFEPFEFAVREHAVTGNDRVRAGPDRTLRPRLFDPQFPIAVDDDGDPRQPLVRKGFRPVEPARLVDE